MVGVVLGVVCAVHTSCPPLAGGSSPSEGINRTAGLGAVPPRGQTSSTAFGVFTPFSSSLPREEWDEVKNQSLRAKKPIAG